MAVLLLLVVFLFYAEENWRGAQAWRVCQSDLRAKGEVLDPHQLYSAGKAENDLSETPIFAEYLKYLRESWKAYAQAARGFNRRSTQLPESRIKKLRPDFDIAHQSGVPVLANYRKGQAIDLSQWQRFYHSIPQSLLSQDYKTPAADVLQALSQFDSDLREIDAAVSRPGGFWPIYYTQPVAQKPLLLNSRIAEVLRLDAVAHLENHQADLAEKDFLLVLRLDRPTESNCLIADLLDLIKNRNCAESILWEGLRRHEWDSGQLVEMESALAATHVLSLAKLAFRGDRALVLRTLDFQQSHNTDAALDDGVYGFPPLVPLYHLRYVRPSGWWDQDRILLCTGHQRYIDGIDLGKGRIKKGAFEDDKEVNPDSQDSSRKEVVNLCWAIYTPVDQYSWHWADKDGPVIAQGETYTRLSRLACRLELYRISHGEYPDRLNQLLDLPPRLDLEVLREQPLHYGRKGIGYFLYSTGWDEKDHGGVPQADSEEGDWTWPSP